MALDNIISLHVLIEFLLLGVDFSPGFQRLFEKNVYALLSDMHLFLNSFSAPFFFVSNFSILFKHICSEYLYL